MGDQTKALRKENNMLKNQLAEIRSELKSVKNGIATQGNQDGASVSRTNPVNAAPRSVTEPNENDVQFLSDSYYILLVRLAKLEDRTNEIERSVLRISKAIDEIQLYSYQYNLKLIGVPQLEGEKAKDTVKLCLDIFSAIRAKVSSMDIDTAHRVPVLFFSYNFFPSLPSIFNL